MPSKPLKAIKPMFQKDKWKILRGDMVQIIAGKDKGQAGKVLRVLRDRRFPRVVVEGKNLVKRHFKRREDQAPQVITMEAPIHYSKVMLIDPVTSQPVRVQWRFIEEGDEVVKVRVSKGRNASRSEIPRPLAHKLESKHDARVGPKDTPQEEVLKVTYNEARDFDISAFPRTLRKSFTTWASSSSAASSSSSSSSRGYPAHEGLLSSRSICCTTGSWGWRSKGASWTGFAASGGHRGPAGCTCLFSTVAAQPNICCLEAHDCGSSTHGSSSNNSTSDSCLLMGGSSGSWRSMLAKRLAVAAARWPAGRGQA